MKKTSLIKAAIFTFALGIGVGCASYKDKDDKTEIEVSFDTHDTKPISNVEDIDEIEILMMDYPGSIRLDRDIYFNTDTNLLDKIGGKNKLKVSKYDKAYAVFKTDDHTYIKYNDNYYYVSNGNINKVDALYEEILKYPNRTELNKELYINKNIDIFHKYDKVDALFSIGDQTFIKYNDEYSYVCNDVLSELDNEYIEASKHPNRIIVESNAYLTKSSTLISNNNSINLDIYQKVYELFKDDNLALIKYNDELYYVNSNDLDTLGNNYIEVDLSDQNVKMYKNNELIINNDCVTGNTNTPTNEGIFKIYQIDGQRYLYGNNPDGSRYKAYVDCFMAFDGGIGFHNVLYRTKPEHFAKDLYLRGKGSHGCINMYKDDALKMYDILKSSDNSGYGYKVLVHK